MAIFPHKEDQCIEILASEAVKAGYSILSFDLPAHGERRHVESEYHVAQAVDDIKIMLAYAQKRFSATALFACSIGASFSMIAAQKIKICQALFLSPVIDLDSLIRKMIVKADVDETRLNREKVIIASDGTVFRADYLAYLQQHRFSGENLPLNIMVGSQDQIADFSAVVTFAHRHKAVLTTVQGAEHYFHHPREHQALRAWVQRILHK